VRLGQQVVDRRGEQLAVGARVDVAAFLNQGQNPNPPALI
jgi:hypothetical protein